MTLPTPCLYIVPLNEEFMNLPMPYLLDVRDPRRREDMKNHLRTALAQPVGLPPSNRVADLLASDSLSAEDHTQLAEWYVYTKYGLVPPGEQLRVAPINLLPCLERWKQAGVMNYLFPRSYWKQLPSKLLIKGTTDKYLLVGADLIRVAEPELRGCSPEMDAYFDSYDGWPYMVVIDTATYSALGEHLAGKFQ